jgi:tetratricopeptide (TPR) repeat protein
MELSSARGRRIFSRPLVYVFSAVLLVRLVALLHMAGSPFLIPSYGDMHFYDDWARHIVAGEIGEPLAFYGLPLYAYLLAAIYKLAGYGPFLPELLQACADAGTSVILYQLAVRIFNRDCNDCVRGKMIGILAALGWAFFEPAQAYAVILMPTSLFVFTFWFVVSLVVQRDTFPAARILFFLGCLIGLIATGVATILFLTPLLLAAIFFKWSNQEQANFWSTRIIAILLLTSGVMCGTAPCWIHNYFWARDPALLSAHSGVNFWIGNNPEANGFPKFPAGLHAGQASMLKDSIDGAERAIGRPLKRSEVSAYWSGKAWAYIRQHFGAWLRLVALKIANFWNAFQYDDLSMITILREYQVIPPGLRFGLVAALALAGSVFAIIRFSTAGWIAAAVLTQMCALLPVFVTERYRLVAVPGLLLFAAYGLTMVWQQLAEGRIRPVWSYIALLALSTAFVSCPKRDASLWALDSYNSGIIALDLGKYEVAQQKLRRAFAYVPENAETNFALGNLAVAQNHLFQAKGYYGSTLILDPTHEGAFNNLGVLALQEKDWKVAARFFQHNLQEHGQDATTHFLLAKSLIGQGDDTAARIEIDRALALNPDQTEFRDLRDEISAGGEN